MDDVAMDLPDRPGALAAVGRALGDAGISVEGGGVFVTGGRGVAHFLFHDGQAAAAALAAAGVTAVEVRDVVLQRLRQDVPGQLAAVCEQMAQGGVNIEVMYSDHDHRLVLVVDDQEAARRVSIRWTQQNEPPA